MLKNKIKRFKKGIKLIGNALLYGLSAFSALIIANMTTQEIVNKVQTNEVNEALDYYGGISNYIGTKGLFKSYTKFKTNNTKDIKIGLAPSVNETTETQIALCVNYLNDIFSVINSNYHFNMIRADKENCDVFVQVKNGDECEEISKAIALTYAREQKNFCSYFQLASADITFNEAYIGNYPLIRNSFIHEAMHGFLNCRDLPFSEDEKYNQDNVPLSVLSYEHSTRMSHMLNCPDLYNQDLKGNKDRINYLKNEFISYTPFDLAAYAARYGNLNDENNKKACTQLIVDTYKTCKEVFGEENKYFLDDIELNNEGYPVRFEQFIKQNESNSFATQQLFSNKNYLYTKYEEDLEL